MYRISSYYSKKEAFRYISLKNRKILRERGDR